MYCDQASKVVESHPYVIVIRTRADREARICAGD